MAFKVFKDKTSNVIFVITAIGALITLISYVRPVINYVSDLNKLVHQYQQINESMEKIEQHIQDYEETRTNKGKSFSIGLRSDTETGKIIYVDENNGIYRAFLDPTTKEYFYYDVEGRPIYCYTQKPVRGQADHIEIRPIVIPDIVILDSDTIQ